MISNMRSWAAQIAEGALFWRQRWFLTRQTTHRAQLSLLLSWYSPDPERGWSNHADVNLCRDGAGWAGQQSWTSVSSQLFNFLINCIIMVGQEVTWGSSGEKQTCKYQRTTAPNSEEGRVDGEGEWPKSYCHMYGKESKPDIKEGEWMFSCLFVHAFLLYSELLTAFTSVRQDIPLRQQLQGIQSDVLDTHNGCIQSSGVSGCRFSPFCYSFCCYKYPKP